MTTLMKASLIVATGVIVVFFLLPKQQVSEKPQVSTSTNLAREGLDAMTNSIDIGTLNQPVLDGASQAIVHKGNPFNN